MSAADTTLWHPPAWRPGLSGKTTLDGKLYRVSDLGGAEPLVERWTLSSRRTGRHHWVRIWPPNGSTRERATAERVIAALRAQQRHAKDAAA
jgi:hypothetical protein